jgi:hypothetical protein
VAYVTSIVTGKPMPSVPEVSDDSAASPRTGGDDMIFEMEGVGSESKAPTAALTDAEKRLRSAFTHVLVHGEFGIDFFVQGCPFPAHRECLQPLPSSDDR